jgi:hypothetical protein
MKTRGQRLKLAMQLRGVKTNEIDRHLGKEGTGFTSRLSNDKKGKRVDLEVVQKIAAFLRVRFQWLQWGTGDMEGETVSELEAMFGETSNRSPPDMLARTNLDIAVDFYRSSVSQAAIDRVRAMAPSLALSPQEIGDMLIEAQQLIIGELAAKVATRKKASAAATSSPAPKTTTKRKAS